MPIGRSDIEVIGEALRNLCGRRPSRATLGRGSFVTLDFGSLVTNADGRIRGEWQLWIYYSAWRIDSNENIVVGSEDDRESIQSILADVETRTLTSVEVHMPSLGLDLNFGDLLLHVFPITSSDAEHWMLYTPSGQVLVAGPGSNWSWDQ
jgi:hypothetical protein